MPTLEQLELESYEQARERSERVGDRTWRLYALQAITAAAFGIAVATAGAMLGLPGAGIAGGVAGGGLGAYFFLFSKREFKIRETA